ncbi:MAG: MlaD family protein [Anaerohalosphaeraceae bacterium]
MIDYNTIQKRRNFIVGLFVLVAFVAFIFLLGRFRDLPLFVSQANSFYVNAKFHDAPGVQKETPVQFCGYQIGRVVVVSPPQYVEDVETGKAWHEVLVTLAIDKKYKNIPSNIEVKLMKRGLGSSYIELRADPEKPSVPLIASRPETKFLCDGLTLGGTMGLSSDFFPPEVQNKLEHLLDSISALADNTNQIIGDTDNITNIKKTLTHVSIASEQANETLKSIQRFSNTGNDQIVRLTGNLDTAISNFQQILEKVNEGNGSIGKLLNDDRLYENLIDTTQELETSIRDFQQILAKINEGEGSMGKMLNDGRLYENLLDSSQELEMALEQIKKWAADAREKGIRIKW